jgi:hypothetical protein
MFAALEIIAFVLAVVFLIVKARRRPQQAISSSHTVPPSASDSSQRSLVALSSLLSQARASRSLDLTAAGYTGLPTEITSLRDSLESIVFTHLHGSLEVLTSLPRLKRIAISGQALSRSDLSVLAQLHGCSFLDLRGCQTVVAAKNTGGAGLCVPEVTDLHLVFIPITFIVRISTT